MLPDPAHRVDLRFPCATNRPIRRWSNARRMLTPVRGKDFLNNTLNSDSVLETSYVLWCTSEFFVLAAQCDMCPERNARTNIDQSRGMRGRTESKRAARFIVCGSPLVLSESEFTCHVSIELTAHKPRLSEHAYRPRSTQTRPDRQLWYTNCPSCLFLLVSFVRACIDG